MNMHNPAALCAAIEAEDITKAMHREAKKKLAGRPKKFPHVAPSAPNTDDGQKTHVTHPVSAVVGSPYPGTNPAHHETIDAIVEVYRLRQDMIRARTKLILQAQASLRRVFAGDKEMAAKTFGEASKNPGHEYRGQIQPYLASIDILDDQQSAYEKELVRDVKRLPIYAWAKAIKGFGDLSLACIIGEASGYRNDTGEFYSVGDFKSVSALWKRMGMAVINGHRQGNPGKGATAADWIKEAYSRTKRSVMWNVGNSLILGMGKFRPVFGEDIDANGDYTYYQKVFANRARYEALGKCPKMVETKKGSGKYVPKVNANGEVIRIELNEKTGRESYSSHAANRAKRYTEKRLLRMLYAEWRRCMA